MAPFGDGVAMASTSGRAPRPNLMAGIVADEEPLRPVNTLTFNKVYSKLGQNSIFEVRPAVIHFSGFKLNRPNRVTVRVINTAPAPHRLHILPPTTPYFTAACEKTITIKYDQTDVINEKKGWVPPGLSEEITIEFIPDTWRYYYDCIRIHSESENLVIPIHAYPAPNEATFPRRVDFGKCTVGMAHSRRVRLQCRAPIEIEYEIVVMRSSPEFAVSPVRGIVPSTGVVPIAIEYEPTRNATSTMELQLRLSQANFEPITCVVTGSGFPGLAREQALEESEAGMSAAERAGMLHATKTAFRSHREITIAAESGELMGAGGGDPFTRAAAHTRRLDTTFGKPIEVRLPAHRPATPERSVAGVWVPSAVATPGQHGTTAYVLMQQPGKLRIKDLQDAISTSRAERAEEELAVKAGLAVKSSLDPLDDPSTGRQLKAALFEKELLAAVDFERSKDLSFQVAVGSDRMDEEAVAAVREARRRAAEARDAAARAADVARSQPELPEAAAALYPAGADPLAPFADQPKRETDLVAGRPRFDPYDNDVWRMRAQVLERFLQAARKVVFRFRASKRLLKIQALFARAGTRLKKAAGPAAGEAAGGGAAAVDPATKERERVAALVAHEFLRRPSVAAPSSAPGAGAGVPVQGSGADGLTPEQAVAAMVRPERMAPHAFPVSVESQFRERKPLPEGSVGDIHVAEPLALKVPLRFELMGYQPEPFAAARAYVPLMRGQPLLKGAAEEDGGPLPMGVVAGIAPPMPEVLRKVPHDRGALSMPSDDGAVAPDVPAWGADPACAIQPRLYEFHDSLAAEVAGWNSSRALEGKPLLSDVWLPRREFWEVRGAPLPALLSGAAPEDSMPDPEGEKTAADRNMATKTVPEWPTLDTVRQQFLLPGRPRPASPGPAGGDPAAALPPGEDLRPPTPDAAAAAEATARATLVIPRQRRQAEVDAAARAKRRELESRLGARAKEFNRLVRNSRARVML